MKKKIFLALLGLVVIAGVLGGIKGLQIRQMIAVGSQFVPPPEVVTTAEVKADAWESTLNAVGTLTAVKGVTVTAELPGKVERIAFAPGAKIRAGDLLVKQDTSSEEAQLRSLEASADLARINLERATELYARKTISRSEYDNAVAQHKQTAGQVDSIRAVIAKKTIRAPFAGRLGIRLINPGQILKDGEPIVSLQSLDPIFADFSLPQQQMSQIAPGMPVRVTTDALAGRQAEGKITAINPELDTLTRSVRVQATLDNADEKLRPGMFANIAVVLPAAQEVLTIPATAVLFAPYSDSVFVVEEAKSGEGGGQGGKVVRQQIVRLAERRGDFVAISSGLKPGQTVVSTGVFKLRNGQSVVVDNTLAPEFKLAPKPQDS